jgi:hypothetical protein
LTQAYSHLRSAKSDDTSAAENFSVVQRQRDAIQMIYGQAVLEGAQIQSHSGAPHASPYQKTGGHVAGQLEGFLLLDINPRTSQRNQSNALLET